MKKLALISSLILFLIIGTITSPVLATTYTIFDKYIGAAPNNAGYIGKDVIGDLWRFDIDRMDITFGSGSILQSIDIFTQYVDDIGYLGSALGDLFISTNGYHPMLPTKDDKYDNGERWEYAFVLDDHTSKAGGSFDIYQIPISNYFSYIKTSTEAYGINIYRAEQEVLLKNFSSLDSKATGNWSVNSSMNKLNFTINNGFDFGTEYLAFHWGPTCANDVIEGVIPEPTTFLLLGSGLLSLGLFGWFRRRKA